MYVTLCRFFTLEEALNYIKEESYRKQQAELDKEKGDKQSNGSAEDSEQRRSKLAAKRTAAAAAAAASSASSHSHSVRRAGSRESLSRGSDCEGTGATKGTVTGTGEDGGDNDAGADRSDSGAGGGADWEESGSLPHPTAAADAVAAGPGSGSPTASSTSTSTSEYDELWCSHCMDDHSVQLCAFCGCKVTNCCHSACVFNCILASSSYISSDFFLCLLRVTSLVGFVEMLRQVRLQPTGAVRPV
jgi:hypothetical protein